LNDFSPLIWCATNTRDMFHDVLLDFEFTPLYRGV
jgi:hypothetical protein